MTIKTFFWGLLIISNFGMCQKKKEPAASTHRIFTTSFESINDLANFYIVPQNHMNSSSHQQSTEVVHSGTFSHKAWIYGVNPESTATQNNNHRGYPTIQFQKTSGGVFHTPCYISFWVWADMGLAAHTPENQWLSFATLTTDSTDSWSRTILANLSYDGFLHLMHVPLQGQSDWLFQTTTVKFPQKQWVKIKIYLDTRPNIGYVKLWQNDTLVSYSKISDGNGVLAQAHFGLYAAPSVSSGVIYNDDLEIRETDGE
jgi:hypothetical protein